MTSTDNQTVEVSLPIAVEDSGPAHPVPLRIAIVYDCLYPHTVGGAERWYRRLADSAARNHEVTYVTRRQWRRKETPEADFAVVTVSAGRELYTKSGRRRILPPLRFGIGVFRYLWRHGGDFDAVDCGNFSYFSLVGARLALKRHPHTVFVAEWFECWSMEYWRRYLGRPTARLGHAIQGIGLRSSQRAITFSTLVAERLRAEGFGGEIVRLPGLYDDSGGTATAQQRPTPTPDSPKVVYAGRHIPEKRVTAIPEAIHKARETMPDLRCTILGDGPDRRRVLRRVADLDLQSVVDCPGFVAQERVEQEMASATCFLLPSSREGYGLAVVEAASHGTPVIVVAGEDNAAVDLIEDGINGFVAQSADPAELASRIVDAASSGVELRRSTAEWFDEHREELSMENSIALWDATFRQLVGAASGRPGVEPSTHSSN